MRRVLAHTAPRSTGDMGARKKARSVSPRKVSGSGLGAFCGSLAQWIERLSTKREVAGPNPAGAANINLLTPPVKAGTSTRGLIRTAEAARVLNSIIRLSAVDLKEIHSDLPQLQNRYGEGRTRTEQRSAVQVPTVREAFSGTAREAFRR